MKVAYAYSEELCSLSNLFEKTNERASAVQTLISSYELPKLMTVVEPKAASREDLLAFHSGDFVEFLLMEDHLVEDDNDAEEFGFHYDCPLLPGMDSYVRLVAGATLQMADRLCSGSEKVAINWAGGWHHAGPAKAAGFCYVNDCVLAILRLRENFPKVLYIDLDAHHGDAVQDAFYTTAKVMTLSAHCYESGFYPGSGGVEEIGIGKGKYHSVNIPFREGLTDGQFVRTVSSVVAMAMKRFQPDAIVVQCGADCLSGDPMKVFNLTDESIVQVVKMILAFDKPTLLLGGGGYNAGNTAILWAKITGEAVLGMNLPRDIPENDLFHLYGPGFELQVDEGRLPNRNLQGRLDSLVAKIAVNLSHIQC